MTNDPTDAQRLGGEDVDDLGDVLRAAFGLFGTLGAMAAGPQELLRMRSIEGSRPTLLTPVEAAEALRRRLISPLQFDRELGRGGYSHTRADVVRAMSRALLDTSTLVEALRRGDINDAEFNDRMAQLGYDELDAQRVASLRFYLPPVQDVIIWMVREVFTPAIRERFGQDEDFPEDALELSRRVGVRDEDMRNYWAAHWELPSPSQGFEMFQRQAETGVTLDDLRTLLRAHDVMPFWRDAMVKIAYNPITRVDVRRLHKLGLLTHAQLVDRYERIGYNPEDAELLAQFTEQLNAQESDDALEPFRTTLRTRVRSMYLSGSIGEGELREAFTALGYSPEQTEAFIAAAELERVSDHRDELRAAIRALYVQGHIDEGATTARLVGFGYSDTEARRIVEPWHALRELRELNDKERADRDLTRADVLGAYEDALLGAEEATTHLRDLGYDDDEIKVLIARVDLKREKAKRTETEAATKALYLARRATRSEATSQLAKAGVPQERATLLVEQWDTQLDARTPELTVAQVSNAYKLHIIQREDAAARLDAAGYSTDDRDILLALVEKGATSA